MVQSQPSFSLSLGQCFRDDQGSTNSLSQATAETVDLGPAHPPKEDAIAAFDQVLPDLKKALLHLRQEHSSENPSKLLPRHTTNTITRA